MKKEIKVLLIVTGILLILSCVFVVIFIIDNSDSDVATIEVIVNEEDRIIEDILIINEDEEEVVEESIQEEGEESNFEVEQLKNQTFENCNLSLTYNPEKYLYFEDPYRQYLGSISAGEARLQTISSQTGNGDIEEEVVIECGGLNEWEETNEGFLFGLKERWSNDGIVYIVDIVENNRKVGGNDYLVIDYTFETEAIGETTERLYLLSDKRNYIIRVVTENDPNDVLEEVGLSIDN